MPGAGHALPAPTTLGELAARLGGSVADDARPVRVDRIAAVSEAGPGALAPLLAPRWTDRALASGAALLVDDALASRVPEALRWSHPHAAWALAELLSTLEPPPRAPLDRGRAFVEEGATVHPTATLGPGAVILRGATIGPGCAIEPNAVVHGGVTLGARVRVGPAAVVGRAGFGWAVGPDGARRRMPHLGGVVVEDDAEIGALATVDAGVLSPTRIGRGAKLDAHVHVAHNGDVGDGAMLAAQTGLAGSVTLGRGVLAGGQVGVADHVAVGDGARLAAKSGVIGDVPAGATFAGYPAVPRVRWLRGMARLFGRGPR